MLGNLFGTDGPVIRFIFRVKDLVILNLLTVICMLPVFTFGPALKALAFTTLKMAREEDGNVVKTYFRNFKLNFKQTVVFGLVCLMLLCIAAADVWALYIMRGKFPTVIVVAAVVVVILVFGILTFAIPMQGRFLNPIGATFLNAARASILKFPKTVIMILSWLFLPAVDLFVSANFLPAVVLLGLSLPAYLNALVYNDFFLDIEERILFKDKVPEEQEE